MPGLSIGIGGGRGIGAGPALGASGGATIAQTAYGAGAAERKGAGVEAHQTFIAVQVAALAFLVFIRWSLPSGGRRREE